MCFDNRVLKAYLREKYGIKVARTKGNNTEYYTLSDHGDIYGPDWGPTVDFDDYGPLLAGKLFNKISDIVDILSKVDKDTKGVFEETYNEQKEEEVKE